MPSTITVGSAVGIGEKEIKTKYPVEDGITFGTTNQIGRIPALIPRERSLVTAEEKQGF